jgi:hypothetical protein
MEKSSREQKLKLKKAGRQEYKRFAEAACKVGLLVSRDAYNRFASPPPRFERDVYTRRAVLNHAENASCNRWKM